ncbi:MAG: YraN family protein, partial [Kiritimatiellae bacterium]|nr:YraN family protein [Kiritimatiellia bacterium]
MWPRLKRLLFRPRPARRPPPAGLWGERQAEAALRAKGYRILGRRVRVGSRDEFDLVARDDDVLVFVEVKTRADDYFGRPAAGADRHKRHYLSRAAVRYLKRLKHPPRAFRFDVVEVLGAPEARAKPAVRHIENAFPLDRIYRVP